MGLIQISTLLCIAYALANVDTHLCICLFTFAAGLPVPLADLYTNAQKHMHANTTKYKLIPHNEYAGKSTMPKRYPVMFLNNDGEKFLKCVLHFVSQAKFPQHITEHPVSQLGRPCTLYLLRA